MAIYGLLFILGGTALLVIVVGGGLGVIWWSSRVGQDPQHNPANAYAYPGGPPAGIAFEGCRVHVGLVEFNDMKVMVCRAGFYVPAAEHLVLSQPAILLPWTGIRQVKEKRTLFQRCAYVSFVDKARAWKVWLTLPIPAERDLPEGFWSGAGED